MANTHFTPILCPKCGVALPAKKINLCAAIADVVRTRPDLSYGEIAASFGICSRTVKRYAKRAGIKRKRGAKPKTVSE